MQAYATEIMTETIGPCEAMNRFIAIRNTRRIEVSILLKTCTHEAHKLTIRATYCITLLHNSITWDYMWKILQEVLV